ncbi:hypothetical protein CL689_02605 [Candidatus Saccharibacteria bacterium]|mgnify:CR=1 FL=1|nr:hypothetical protein [Candidatus Saccharibacteria bacterium]|tara:strand:+ start:1948 stop:2643 length:696 start_codon:yes stop_codon:yes gene_type:complete
MTSLSNAIKVAIQATKESASTPGIHHTVLLNDVASRLGYKNFRALVASEQSSGVSQAESDSPRTFDFEPFTLYCYSSDDLVSVVSYKIDGELLSRLFEFSVAAKRLRTDVSHTYWQEEAIEPRTSMASRPVVSPGGGVGLEAEVYDKHSCENISTYGEVEVEVLYALVSGVNPQNLPAVAVDYIWDDVTRSFYMLSDVNEPEDWIEVSTPSIESLLGEYEDLCRSGENEEA